MQTAEFATTIQSDVAIVVDRTMKWPAGAGAYGSHADRAVDAPSTHWYLAEGATHSGFDLFYLIENPGDQAAEVTVQYLLPAPAPPKQETYRVSAKSRFNIWVNTIAGLSSTDVSAVFASTVPIIVERAMYLTGGRRTFEAGHESAGIAASALTWYFAEGATGDYFDLFLLLANPNDTSASVSVQYLLPDGSSLRKAYVVEPRSRFNIWVDTEDERLRSTAVSALVTSTNSVPSLRSGQCGGQGPPRRRGGRHMSRPARCRPRAAGVWPMARPGRASIRFCCLPTRRPSRGGRV
jgi:hypothetical protein